MKNLLLTLGHNSSAILIEDGQIKWGFETERITSVKSDSRFPSAVLDMMKVKPDAVYVTHWATDNRLSSMSAKHWMPESFDGIPIITTNPDLTHHDTHIYGALSYANGFINDPEEEAFGLVIDGFGNYGEHLSIYRLTRDGPKLLRRIHGYDTSLGLWYQYATAFMGMKMHEDEYKLLGYEVHVPEDLVASLSVDTDIRASKWLEDMNKSVFQSKYDPVYNLNALPAVRQAIFDELSKVCMAYNISDPSSFFGRTVLAYYVQQVLERVVLALVKHLGARHLLCAGGVFYNVKLNKCLLDALPANGQICVYPLAGDQGNAIGLYNYYNGFRFPDTLCWGVRELREVGYVPNMHVLEEDRALEMVKTLMSENGLVNLVRGNMEFGPRALCNTSTLALPTSHNVDKINRANERNTVMPMAPVLNMSTYLKKFEKTNQIWRSSDHMVIAMEYVEHPQEHELGVAHRYNYPHVHHTGRPQVADPKDKFMQSVLRDFGGMLINTSFNFHGKPIAHGMESIIENHMMQYTRDQSIHTVVIKNV